jgi:hypothetical protein
MKVRLRRRYCVSAVLLVVGLCSPGVLAQDPQKVELIPATIELPTKGEVETQLILRNKSQQPLKDISVSWFSASGVSINPNQLESVATLGPQAETFWTLRLSQSADGIVPGNVYFRVNFQTGDVPQVLYATLGVNNRQANEVDQVVSVVPKTSSTLLNEQRPGQVFLVINNKGNQPIRIGTITTRGPDFIKATPDMQGFAPDANGFVQIAPRDSINVPVQMKVTDAVLPGKHLFIFQVPVEWGAKEYLQTASVIAQQEFDVGILGESEILTALGVPSFLILPGFLIITSFLLLAKLNRRETLQGESVLKTGTNPYFWVIAITLAGAMAFLYPVATKLVKGTPRDYLIGYGLYDIVIVWLASVLTGIAAWVLFELAKHLWSWLFIPAENDDAASVLRKLYLQGLGTSLEQIDVTLDGSTGSVFLLQKRKKKREKIWAGSFIQIRPLKSDRNEKLDSRIARQLASPKTKILKRITLVGKWVLLQTFFWQGTITGEIEIIWKPDTNPSGTLLIDLPKQRGNYISIIHEE